MSFGPLEMNLQLDWLALRSQGLQLSTVRIPATRHSQRVGMDRESLVGPPRQRHCIHSVVVDRACLALQSDLHSSIVALAMWHASALAPATEEAGTLEAAKKSAAQMVM